MITKLKKTQMLLVYSLFVCICGISFIVLLLSNHLYNIKIEKTFKDFNSRSYYTLTFQEAKHCENKKYSLFSWDDYNFSGYCIKEVYLTYNNLSVPLKEILKKNYLKIEEIFKNTTKIEETKTIEKYENTKEKYSITLSNPVGNYKEVIFSKGN